MTRFSKFLGVVVLAFAVINALYLFLLPAIDWEFRKTKEAHGFKDKQFKVLVFGNSTGMDGINTELLSDHFGSAYNFSVGGATLETNYIQLKDYLRNNSKPGKVLLFLSSSHTRYRKEKELHPVVEYYYQGLSGVPGLRDVPLFKFKWLFLANIKKLMSADHRSAQVVNGQLRINRVLPDNTLPGSGPDTCFSNEFYSKPGYESMWKMISLCHKEEIPIELFEMPCWKGFQNKCPDISIGSAATGEVAVHNLNYENKCDTLFDPRKDWLSKNHLNYSGSVKVTNEIIRILSAPKTISPASINR